MMYQNPQPTSTYLHTVAPPRTSVHLCTPLRISRLLLQPRARTHTTYTHLAHTPRTQTAGRHPQVSDGGHQLGRQAAQDRLRRERDVFISRQGVAELQQHRRCGTEERRGVEERAGRGARLCRLLCAVCVRTMRAGCCVLCASVLCVLGLSRPNTVWHSVSLSFSPRY